MSARFTLNVGALRAVEGRVMNLVEHAAELARTEVVEGMENAPPRTGREYPIPGTGSRGRQRRGKKLNRPTYTASAPGEPPAVREGLYRDSWKTSRAVRRGDVITARAYTDRKVGPNDEYVLGELLEYGTSDLVNYRVAMEPRPHVRPAMDNVAPKIRDLVRHVSA